MKKLLSFVLAVTCMVSIFTMSVPSSAEMNTKDLVLQDISYDETIGRVNQADSGFTTGSTYIYSSRTTETTPPRNDSNFEFYYIDLGKYSSNRGFEDKLIDDYFITFLDQSLSNLRKNGGACIIRACYANDGQNNAEPADFNMLLKHQIQLCNVFKNYPDIISAIECGMIGAYGEMHSGIYSDSDHKRQVLESWLTQLPDEICVNVRTDKEYYDFVNFTSLYKNKYAKQPSSNVPGKEYPKTFADGNFWEFSFEEEPLFNRIGIYNDAMIQDGNDGGTFRCSRENFVHWLSMRTKTASYGGEFSGASAKNGYPGFRTNSTWLPCVAIPEFYKTHLTYYHGGNRAYTDTGLFKPASEATLKYATMNAAEKAIDDLKVRFYDYSSDMPFGVKNIEEKSDGVYVTYTIGGWSSAKVGNAFIDAIKNTVNLEADLTAYKGQSVASFFEDHLGYRIVLKSSYLNQEVDKGGVLNIRGTVDNTGFTNITRKKVAEIVLKKGKTEYVTRVDSIDANSWDSASRNEYLADVKLPANIESGEWEVYLRIAGEDNKGNTSEAGCIRFANAGRFPYSVSGTGAYDGSSGTRAIIYSTDVCANYIGKFTVTETSAPLSSDEFTQVKAFNDVADNFWGKPSITQMCSIGLMSGTSPTTFAPNDTTTRAMLVKVLYNMQGEPNASEYENPFKDVKEGQWYTNAIKWAYAKGVVAGTSKDTYSPNDTITREQFATILYRYAKEIENRDVSKQANASTFTDFNQTSEYAKTAIRWANAEGYITGMTPTVLNPKGSATRAQMASILSRYL